VVHKLCAFFWNTLYLILPKTKKAYTAWDFPQILGFRESIWDLGNFPSNIGIFIGAGNFKKYL